MIAKHEMLAAAMHQTSAFCTEAGSSTSSPGHFTLSASSVRDWMCAGISVDALKKTKIPFLSGIKKQFPFYRSSVREPNEIKKLYMIHFMKLCNDIT
jgi:hypothetical protein